MRASQRRGREATEGEKEEKKRRAQKRRGEGGTRAEGRGEEREREGRGERVSFDDPHTCCGDGKRSREAY